MRAWWEDGPEYKGYPGMAPRGNALGGTDRVMMQICGSRSPACSILDPIDDSDLRVQLGKILDPTLDSVKDRRELAGTR
jgi:hypothetical protein